MRSSRAVKLATLAILISTPFFSSCALGICAWPRVDPASARALAMRDELAGCYRVVSFSKALSAVDGVPELLELTKESAYEAMTSRYPPELRHEYVTPGTEHRFVVRPRILNYGQMWLYGWNPLTRATIAVTPLQGVGKTFLFNVDGGELKGTVALHSDMLCLPPLLPNSLPASVHYVRTECPGGSGLQDEDERPAG